MDDVIICLRKSMLVVLFIFVYIRRISVILRSGKTLIVYFAFSFLAVGIVWLNITK